MVVLCRSQVGLARCQSSLNLLVEEAIRHAEALLLLGDIGYVSLFRLLERTEQSIAPMISLHTPFRY